MAVKILNTKLMFIENSQTEGNMFGFLWQMPAVNLQSDLGPLEQEPSLALG
jgi:hypothetical protein